MIDGNMECEALLALIPKPKRSSTRRRKATTDNEEVMNAGEILALLPVAPAAKKRKTWLKRVRSNGRRDQMTGAMQQQLLAARRYNNSGQAVRYDGLIKTDTRNAPLRGKSCWRKWLPETILRAAFSKASNRDFARSAQTNFAPLPTGISQCSSLNGVLLQESFRDRHYGWGKEGPRSHLGRELDHKTCCI